MTLIDKSGCHDKVQLEPAHRENPMPKTCSDLDFNETLVAHYYEAEMLRVWGPTIEQLIELCPDDCDSDVRQTVKTAAEQTWIRFLNVLEKNPRFGHVLILVLRKLNFEETMPYKKLKSENGSSS